MCEAIYAALEIAVDVNVLLDAIYSERVVTVVIRGFTYVAEDPATCFSFQKKEEFSTRRQYFYIVHKLCVSWTFFLFVSIALFIVCKIKTVLHLLTCNKLRYCV